MTHKAAPVIRVCVALYLSFLVPVVAGAAQNLSDAMGLMRQGDWAAALQAAGADRTVANDIIEWHRLRAGRGEPDQVEDFLSRRPDWPGLAWLRRESEAIVARSTNEAILAFYEDEPPQTAEGFLSQSKALIARGEDGEGQAGVVLAWRSLPMGSKVQELFLKDFAALLKPHHSARLDRMLWDGHYVSAKRMLPLVDEGYRKLAQARIALHEQAPGVDVLIAAVPEELQGSAGLAHGRFEWRDRKGRDDDAIELLLERSASPAGLGEPDKWARRRAVLARQEMRSGNDELAYRIASSHHMTEGSAFADLEWLSGYLALRKLNDPTTAIEHFQRFDGAVVSPISKGRAGYWLGLTHEALGDADAAQAAYDMGATFQTSFYGLLAAERIGRPFDPLLANLPDLPDWRDAPFMSSSVLEAGLMLLDAGERNLAERFLTHLVEDLEPEQAAQLGEMVIDKGEPHLAVMIGKRAARKAVVLHAAYYPLHPLVDLNLPMAPEMSLAIARRESEFDPVVVSSVGARGLMQIMPATARKVASDIGVLASHRTDRLLTDWKYNAKLGSRYLAELAGNLGGNVAMMSAGYNAGPGRPIRWMKRFGDPRRGQIDIVDWIEHIPFDETRNYVMRVTESLPVYRARTGQDPLPVPFSQELVGSTLSSFAP